MTIRRFFKMWMDDTHKEFMYLMEPYDVHMENLIISGMHTVDESLRKDICIASKFSQNTKHVMVLDDQSNFWVIHPDLLNAYGTRLLAYIAAKTSPAFAENCDTDRKFIIINGYEQNPPSDSYIESLRKLFGFWNFDAFLVLQTEDNGFEILQQQFEEIRIVPPMDGVVH